MTTIGYARPPPVDDTAAIRAELTAAGCTAVFLDEGIPIRADRPQLRRALAAVPAGGTLVVCRLIHIGQSLAHLADLLAQLDHRRIRLRTLHEQLDTAEHGELLRQATQGLIDADRAWRSDATRDGLAAAAATGRRLGRPAGPLPLTQKQDELAQELKRAGLPAAEIADLIGVSRSKLYRAQPFGPAPTTGEN